MKYSHSYVGMKTEEVTLLKSTPNEFPSWELCKYFHLLPQPADRVIPLTFLINHQGVKSAWERRNWISGHTTVGNSSHQHPVCNPILSFYHHIKASTSAHKQVKIAVVDIFLSVLHVEHLAPHMGLQKTIYLFVIAKINETESLYFYSHLLYL